MRILQLLEHCASGMAIEISAAHGDGSVRRRNCGQEIGRGGGAAAVVTDLEGIRMPAAACEHARFAGGFSVALKQRAGAAVAHLQNERIVVAGSGGGLI